MVFIVNRKWSIRFACQFFHAITVYNHLWSKIDFAKQKFTINMVKCHVISGPKFLSVLYI